MPKMYEDIRDKFRKAGMSDKKAKSKAAAIYVGKGKTKVEAEALAYRLKKDGYTTKICADS